MSMEIISTKIRSKYAILIQMNVKKISFYINLSKEMIILYTSIMFIVLLIMKIIIIIQHI